MHVAYVPCRKEHMDGNTKHNLALILYHLVVEEAYVAKPDLLSVMIMFSCCLYKGDELD